MSSIPVRFDEGGLIPAVIQDADSGEVLMMAYMNPEALDRTRETGLTHFWSRSRKRLWQKGETSGNVQRVRSIGVNCYENCLLVRVEQVGAACHTGYPTCFFREIDANGSLVTIQERSFDPESVYGHRAALDPVLATWIGAYRWLADHDLESQSQTSRHLRKSDPGDLAIRVADELTELAGVLRGEHAHESPSADVMLEASQVLYWGVVTAIRAGLSNEEINACLSGEGDARGGDVVARLADEARRWRQLAAQPVGARLGAIAALASAAGEAVDLSLHTIIEHDLAELRSRPYLGNYFAARSAGAADL